MNLHQVVSQEYLKVLIWPMDQGRLLVTPDPNKMLDNDARLNYFYHM